MVPIPGTKRVKYLMENIASTDIVITPAEMESINSIADEVAGERYNEAGMKIVNG